MHETYPPTHETFSIGVCRQNIEVKLTYHLAYFSEHPLVWLHQKGYDNSAYYRFQVIATCILATNVLKFMN